MVKKVKVKNATQSAMLTTRCLKPFMMMMKNKQQMHAYRDRSYYLYFNLCVLGKGQRPAQCNEG